MLLGFRYKLEKKLDTKVFFKPTNRFLYLPFNSGHPIQHKTAIIKGEAIRCMRNSSSKSEWLAAMNIIFKGLRARGYPAAIIQRHWKNIKYDDRQKYIYEQRVSKKPDKEMVFTAFHPLLKYYLSRWIAKYPLRPLLITKRLNKFSNRQIVLLESYPPMIVFKDFEKIGKSLISAKQHWKYKCIRERDQNAQEE